MLYGVPAKLGGKPGVPSTKPKTVGATLVRPLERLPKHLDPVQQRVPEGYVRESRRQELYPWGAALPQFLNVRSGRPE